MSGCAAARGAREACVELSSRAAAWALCLWAGLGRRAGFGADFAPVSIA